MNIDDLQSLHGDTRQDARHNGTMWLDMSVGHKDVESDKHSRHQHIWQQVYQPSYRNTQHLVVSHRVCCGGDKDGETGSYHYKYWEDKENRQIVGKGAKHGTRPLHLPYLVERFLDVAHQHQYRVEHKHQTDAEEDAALGMNQVAVHEANNDVGCLRLRLQGIAKPHLYIFIIAEATSYGKHHSQDGNDGQQRGISQGRSSRHDPFGRKEAYGQHHLLHHLNQQEPQRRNVTLGNPPDILREKIDYSLQLLILHS